MGLKEADYAASPWLKHHRWISAAVAVVMLLAAGYHLGVGRAFREGASFVLPLVLIWQSDHLAHWAIRASGHWLSATNADKWLRRLGWVILVLLGADILIGIWAGHRWMARLLTA